jgi:hypothetical protein
MDHAGVHRARASEALGRSARYATMRARTWQRRRNCAAGLVNVERSLVGSRNLVTNLLHADRLYTR